MSEIKPVQNWRPFMTITIEEIAGGKWQVETCRGRVTVDSAERALSAAREAINLTVLGVAESSKG